MYNGFEERGLFGTRLGGERCSGLLREVILRTLEIVQYIGEKRVQYKPVN